MKLVECVPNFSEGRDREKIAAITREIEAVPGVKLLDIDPGESTNRMVFPKMMLAFVVVGFLLFPPFMTLVFT